MLAVSLLLLSLLLSMGLSGCTAVATRASQSAQSATGVLAANPASLSFGNVAVGSQDVQSLTVSNTGAATVNVTQATITGAGFSAVGTSTSSFSIVAGQSATIQMQFAPSATGAASGSLSVVSDASNSPLSVPLSGTGTQPGTMTISGQINPTVAGVGAKVTVSGASNATTTPNSSGNFTFSGLVNGSYTVTPSNAGYTFNPSSYDVTINGANVTGVNFTGTATTTFTVTTSVLPSGIAGSSYSSALSAAGGTPPYSWVVSSGNLPSGLILASNGNINGTPTTAGQYNFTVRVTDSSSPVRSASAPLAISIAPGVTATPGATAAQYVMSYTAANSSQCTIEVSTSPTYNPPVHAVDPTMFANANFDGQTNTGSRAFVVGQKWIAQENVARPFIPVGAASRPSGSTLVTVSYPNQPFVVGDNITITGMSNLAYNDSWARVDVASTNSFSYGVLTAAPAGGDTFGGGIITRANRYSLALAADTTYYYRIGGASNTCGASPATGSFTTMNIPNGNTWAEGPVRDNNGNQIEPTIPESRTATLVDPLTGALTHRVGLTADYNGSPGWFSGFYRVCSLTTSSNGFYHCLVPSGSSGTLGLYSVKSTGESHWLGVMHFNYTDSNGFHCCNVGSQWFGSNDSSTTDNSNPNLFYTFARTNSGNPPSKEVIISAPFTGNDAVDAVPNADWATGAATALTPDPSNTFTDKMAAFAASDPYFVAAHFNACDIVDVEGSYATGYCNSFDQGSPTVLFAFNVSTGSIVGMGLPHENGQCRWCGSHGIVVTGSQKWIDFSTAYTTNNQTGQWNAQLVSSIGTGNTSLSVTAPRWQAGTSYNTSAIAGFMVVDSNNNLQVATAYGTSGGSQPTWNTTTGGTTPDGSVVWTNQGAASNPNEPQNIFPFLDANAGKYWSFLMPVAGGTGGGGFFNGDLFHFEDGTNECVRVVTVGTSGSWTLVTRAVNGNGLTLCSSTASSHAAGASLRALCEEGSSVNGFVAHYWDYIDDSHLTDTTGTYFVRLAQGIGHGYTRQGAPHGNIWNTFNVINAHNPFVAADFNSLPTFSLSRPLTFAGLTTDAPGVTHQDYTNWDFESASFQDSALGSLFFVAGASSTAYGGFSKVAGTSSIYKYNLGNTPFSYTLPFVPTSGGNTIKDISGPGSLLVDNGSVPLSCVVVSNGECWPGSIAGAIYANLPVVDAGSGNNCNPGGENYSYFGHDWCMMNTSTYGNALNQYGLIQSNFITNSNGIPFYGAGLSRRLIQNLAGGFRLQGFAPHAVTDGSGALFESCIADPHQPINGFATNPLDCNIYLATIPPPPLADGIDRTNYEIVSITIGPGSGGATHVRVKYGYEENEPTRGTTWPPAMTFYCTQYQGTCYFSDQNLSLNSQPALQIGVPQRVLFYQVEYLNASNQVVASDPIATVAIP